MPALSLPLLGLSLIFSIALCVHVVRTNQQQFWLWIVLMFQPLGGVVYLVAVVLPEIFGGSRAKRLAASARETLDPGREYRAAQQAAADTPTVRNQMRLANAAGELGRWDEAEQLYAEAARGPHSDDPALLLGRARALVELNRSAEALPILQSLGELGESGRTPQAGLTMARAYHALGRDAEADTAYQWAAARLPGLEGLARYAAFLAETGRKAEAREAMAEIDKRAAKATAHFRKEAKIWRDFAAARVG